MKIPIWTLLQFLTKLLNNCDEKYDEDGGTADGCPVSDHPLQKNKNLKRQGDDDDGDDGSDEDDGADGCPTIQ